MKTAPFLMLLILTACASNASIPASIALWPTAAPGSEGQTAPEVVTMRSDAATPYSAPRIVPIVTHINNPSITPFLPDPPQANGIGLIIAPGGGQTHLSVQHEGYDVARVFAARGFTCFVLKYRLPKEPGSPYKFQIHSLMDAQRAIRYVRANTQTWNLDPHRIGYVGFSTGGQLGLLAATTFDHPVPPVLDAIDQTSSRPDFLAALYPAGLADPSAITITKSMPPTFLADSNGDARSKTVVLFFAKLQAAAIPSELHLYALGPEGFGVRPASIPISTWPDRFIDWMNEEGLLKQK